MRILATLTLLAIVMAFALAGEGNAKENYARDFEQIKALVQKAQYTEALGVAQALAEKIGTASSKDDVDYAGTSSWIGFLYQVQGKHREAGPYFEKSVEIYRKLLPPDHPDLATATNNLGVYYLSLGKREDAEALYRRALEMRERARTAEDASTADTLVNLASLYGQDGRTSDAKSLLERAITIRRAVLKPDDPLIASGLQALAGLYEQLSDYPGAETKLREALTIRRRSQVADHPELTGVLSRLGQNLNRQQKYGESEDILRNAAELRLSNKATAPTDLANTLSDLALNRLQQDDYLEAEALYRKVLEIREQALAPNSLSIADALMRLGEVLDREGRSADALETIRRGTAIREAMGQADKETSFHYLRHVMFAWHNFVPSDDTSTGLLNEAMVKAQGAEHTETASALSRMAARFAAKDPRLQELVRERDDQLAARKQLDRQLVASFAIEPRLRPDTSAIKKDLAMADARVSAIDVDLSKSFPDYFDLIRPAPLDVKQVSALLKEHEALITIACGSEESYVWAISREKAGWHAADFSSEVLNEQVAVLRSTLDISTLQANPTPDMRLFNLGLAHELYTQLLRPLEHIFQDKSQLIIVPCGALTSLPFGLLVRDKPAVSHPTLSDLARFEDVDWLVRHHAVSVLPSVPSLKLLRSLSEVKENRKPFIGFGDPKFKRGKRDGETDGSPPATGQTRGYSTYWQGTSVNLDALVNDMPEIPQTAEELRTIAGKLGAATEDVHLAEGATETAVKTADLLPYKVVYFATHGLVAGEIKGFGEPALVFTPPETPTDIDDGLLSASEVSDLRLDADWVVLSACNTASGASEAPGAEALSHWRVDSAATAKLAIATFEKNAQSPGIGRSEALRQAMLDSMKKSDDPWSVYPAFWAPLTLVGEGSF
jgi:CHAT domain-containing protein/Tfp pilus assembly protein PilF